MARARRVEVTFEDAPSAPDEDVRTPGPTPDRTHPAPGDGTGDDGGGTPAARSRRAWWWLAVPVVAVLALVAGQVVTDLRERAALAELRAVRGVVAPVDGTLDATWTTPPGATLTGAVRAGPLLVVARVTGDHGVLVEGLGTTTGEPAWSREVVAPRAAWSPVARPDVVPCVVLQDDADGARTDPAALPRAVACLVTDGGWDVVDTVARYVPATSSRLLVLDPADGGVRAEHDVPTGARWLAPVGPDVVLAGERDGELHAWSVTVADGGVRWDVALDASPDERDVEPGGEVVAWTVDPRTVAVDTGSDVTLVSTAGEVLGTVVPEASADRSRTVLDRTFYVSTPLGAAVVGNAQGTVLASAAGRVDLDGSPVPTIVDDGSVPGLVLTRTPLMKAWDATDGTPRWETTLVDTQDAMVVRGTVVVGGSSSVRGLDGRTGEELWRVARPTATGAVVTDGRLLYVLGTQGRHRAPYDLVALHLADGSEAWRTPMPVDAGGLSSVKGMLATGWATPDGGLVYRVLR